MVCCWIPYNQRILWEKYFLPIVIFVSIIEAYCRTYFCQYGESCCVICVVIKMRAKLSQIEKEGTKFTKYIILNVSLETKIRLQNFTAKNIRSTVCRKSHCFTGKIMIWCCTAVLLESFSIFYNEEDTELSHGVVKDFRQNWLHFDQKASVRNES